METELYRRLLAIVLARGLSPNKVGRYSLVTVWDGGVLWDVAKLGAVPTQAQIDAVTTAQLATADAYLRAKRRDGTLWTPSMVALVRALNARLRTANVDQVTVGAFRTAIETEYDAIVP